MDATEQIIACFEKDPNDTFTPKAIAEAVGMEAAKVRGILSRLVKEERIERVSRGKYRYLFPAETKLDEKVLRYLTTLEKTCSIAIHELMLTEPLVGKKDKVEIEHQIAYFARILVRSRWQLEHGTQDEVDVDERIFKKAKRIHEWSKMVFEKSLADKAK